MATFTPRTPRRLTLWQRLDLVARYAFPSAIALGLVILGGLPLHLPGQEGATPQLALASVFFWALYRPEMLPPPAVFLVGLAADLLAATPLGITVVVMLLLYGTVGLHRRRLARQSFLVVWLACLVYLAGAQALAWLLNAVLTLRLLPAGPALYQFALTAALYPVLAYLLIRADRSLLPEQAEAAR